ncbi:hypothetical protein [Streptosporangium saharense]
MRRPYDPLTTMATGDAWGFVTHLIPDVVGVVRVVEIIWFG